MVASLGKALLQEKASLIKPLSEEDEERMVLGFQDLE
jgi:hypothetical protein